MKLVYHGHSFVEVIFHKQSLLIDPFINGNSGCDVSFDDVIAKNIQAIIITHGHDDHLGETIELAQVSGAVVITSYELGEYLMREKWLDNVSTQWIWGRVAYDDFSVKFFQAWHGWWITSFTHGYTTVATWVILEIDDKTIYHAWDTWLFSDMKLLNKFYDVDVACLPIGDRYTMGIEDAAIATGWIKPKIVVPVHYDTRDVIQADTKRFERLVKKQAPKTTVEVLQGWDSIKI